MATPVANTNIKHTSGSEIPDTSSSGQSLSKLRANLPVLSDWRSWFGNIQSGLGNWRVWGKSAGFLIPASLSLVGLGFYFFRSRSVSTSSLDIEDISGSTSATTEAA